MARYYLGVDWADRVHQLYGGDENGIKVMEMTVQESYDGMAELGRWLDQSRAEQVELWAAIEKPHGRIVDFFWITGWWFTRSIPRFWIVLGTGFE